MKKLFSIMLLLTAMCLMMSSCSKDDDKITLSQTDLVGTWDVTSYATTGDYKDLPSGYIYIKVYDDNTYKVKFLTNTYSGKYRIDGNTMIGTTSDPITEYFRFESLDNGKATIDYSSSEGDKYKFIASKK